MRFTRRVAADAVRQRLDRFADDLASRLPGMVVVERTDSLAVTLWPVRRDALPVTCATMVTRCRSRRWHVRADVRSWAGLTPTLRSCRTWSNSIVVGRAEEVHGPNRSRVAVTLADGTTAVEAGYEGLAGCLPRPRWRQRGKVAKYASYSG